MTKWQNGIAIALGHDDIAHVLSINRRYDPYKHSIGKYMDLGMLTCIKFSYLEFSIFSHLLTSIFQINLHNWPGNAIKPMTSRSCP